VRRRPHDGVASAPPAERREQQREQHADDQRHRRRRGAHHAAAAAGAGRGRHVGRARCGQVVASRRAHVGDGEIEWRSREVERHAHARRAGAVSGGTGRAVADIRLRGTRVGAARAARGLLAVARARAHGRRRFERMGRAGRRASGAAGAVVTRPGGREALRAAAHEHAVAVAARAGGAVGRALVALLGAVDHAIAAHHRDAGGACAAGRNVADRAAARPCAGARRRAAAAVAARVGRAGAVGDAGRPVGHEPRVARAGVAAAGVGAERRRVAAVPAVVGRRAADVARRGAGPLVGRVAAGARVAQRRRREVRAAVAGGAGLAGGVAAALGAGVEVDAARRAAAGRNVAAVAAAGPADGHGGAGPVRAARIGRAGARVDARGAVEHERGVAHAAVAAAGVGASRRRVAAVPAMIRRRAADVTRGRAGADVLRVTTRAGPAQRRRARVGAGVAAGAGLASGVSTALSTGVEVLARRCAAAGRDPPRRARAGPRRRARRRAKVAADVRRRADARIGRGLLVAAGASRAPHHGERLPRRCEAQDPDEDGDRTLHLDITHARLASGNRRIRSTARPAARDRRARR